MLGNYYEKRGSSGTGHAFRAKGFSPDWRITGVDAESAAMASLPPFLRTLLVADGTVTKSLEAYYWEPVIVDGVSNTVLEARAEIPWLEVQPGEQVVARSVLLRGGRTKTLYASAFSIIRFALIPQQLRDSLLAGTLGIGELIRECGLETFRELQEFGLARDMSEYGGPKTNSDCVFRSYRIILDHRPAILVSECFPIAAFSGGHQDS